MNTRAQVLLWGAQRASAAVLVLCVVVHFVTIVYAVRNGLTAGEILGRTRGNFAWAGFYATFVVMVAVHAAIGVRNMLFEAVGWRGFSLDLAVLVFGLALTLSGLRAVWAVFS